MVDPVNECSPNFDNENKWSKDIETMQSTRPFQCSTSKMDTQGCVLYVFYQVHCKKIGRFPIKIKCEIRYLII